MRARLLVSVLFASSLVGSACGRPREAVVAPPRQAEVAAPRAELVPTTAPATGLVEPAAIAEQHDGGGLAPRAWYTNEALVPHDETRALVLMYHSFENGTAVRGITAATLDAQLSFLERKHVVFVPMHEFLRWREGERELPARVAVLTIDDGEKTFYDHGFEVFKKHDAPFTLGIPTAAIEQAKERKVTMTWDQLREIVASGLAEIASHGHTHAALAKLPADKMRLEARRPKELIESELGVTPETFFFPSGSMNDAALKEVELAGYRAAFGAVGAKITDETGRFRIPRFGVANDTTPFVMTRFLQNAGIDVKVCEAPSEVRCDTGRW
ncbi:MAG: polysaccharide deacetylase family protein [Polyangiaceae bacterium]